MQLMEVYCRSETPPPAAEAVADLGGAEESIRWNSDSSTLTAENCEDPYPLTNVKPNDSTTWTDKKHGLYLEHLEVSFVKQLHQSMGLLAQRSEKNKRDKNVCQMCPRVYHLKCTEVESPPPASADMQEYLTLGGPKNYWKFITYPGLGICSQPFSASSQYHEGTGQNFVDEANQNKSITKTALAD